MVRARRCVLPRIVHAKPARQPILRPLSANGKTLLRSMRRTSILVLTDPGSMVASLPAGYSSSLSYRLTACEQPVHGCIYVKDGRARKAPGPTQNNPSKRAQKSSKSFRLRRSLHQKLRFYLRKQLVKLWIRPGTWRLTGLYTGDKVLIRVSARSVCFRVRICRTHRKQV